jgi:hypothetical protein
MLLGEPQNTIKSHLVFTALFCFAPFSVFSSRMSAPHCRLKNNQNPKPFAYKSCTELYSDLYAELDLRPLYFFRPKNKFMRFGRI